MSEIRNAQSRIGSLVSHTVEFTGCCDDPMASTGKGHTGLTLKNLKELGRVTLGVPADRYREVVGTDMPPDGVQFSIALNEEQRDKVKKSTGQSVTKINVNVVPSAEELTLEFTDEQIELIKKKTGAEYVRKENNVWMDMITFE